MLVQDLSERQGFFGDISYWTNCMIEIKLDKLLNRRFVRFMALAGMEAKYPEPTSKPLVAESCTY